MSPPLESPLAKLEERIKKRETVKPVDIKKAIDDELKALEKLYPNPNQEFDKNAHIEEVKKFKLRLDKEHKDLYKAWEEGRLDFFQRSRNELWSKGNEDLKDISERPKRLAANYQKSRNLTDPAKGGIGEARIDDYEGYDILGGTRLSDTTNAHNPTRNALSGYLTAMGMESDQKAQEEYAKAYKIFSDKWINGLNTEDLKESMGMGKYLPEIYAHVPSEALSNETKGYLCGLLKLAEEGNPEIYDAYKAYLFDNLKKLADAGKLNFDESTVTNNYERDAKKGESQILNMAGIQTAKEWVELFTGMRNAFEKLRSDASTLSDKLGFEYRDPKIIKFLERDPATITPKDKKELKEVSELVASEAYGRVLTKNNDTNKFLQEVKAKVDAYKGDNSKELQKEMNDVIDEFSVIAITPGATPADLVNILEEIENAAAKARVIESRIVGHKKKKEDAKKKKKEAIKEESEFIKAWKNPEWVDPMFKVDRVRVVKRIPKLPYRNDNGTRGGTIPSGTILKIVAPSDKVKEVQGIRYVKVEYNGKKVWVDQSYLELLTEEVSDTREFIEEKHLKETTDGSRFKYELGPPKIKNDLGQILILTGNKEIDKRLAWRLNDYLRIISEREGGALKSVTMGRKFNTINDVRDYLDGYFVGRRMMKDAVDVRRFFGAMNDSYEHSILQYETKPKFNTLSKDYRDKVLGAWNTTVSEAMHLPRRSQKKGPGDKEKKERVPAKRDQITAEAHELVGRGLVYLKYIPCLNQLAKYELNPQKYPNGVNLPLPFNNRVTPVNVRYEHGGTSGRLRAEYGAFPQHTYFFNSMKELANHLNAGSFQRVRTYDVMRDKSSYKGTEGLVGELDFVQKTKDEGGQLHLEFDWEGAFDDPDIYVRTLPHGRIQYRIQWENANHDGKAWREGMAEDFDAFINIMAHIRQWGNRYDDIPKSRLRTEKMREHNYNLLADSFNIGLHESRIGRMVKYDTGANYSTDIFLDWGGGNDAYSAQNARLHILVGTDGLYHFKVERKGLPVIAASGRAGSIEEIASRVATMKAAAGF